MALSSVFQALKLGQETISTVLLITRRKFCLPCKNYFVSLQTKYYELPCS